VYFTSVVNLNESRVGLLSERMDVLIDCETYIFKALNIWSHKEKLGRGISYKGTNVSDDWLQAPENSPLERMSKKACEIYIKDVLKLPENAHLSGNSWKCDDKFYKSNNECIELPPFSYSSPSGFVCMDDWEKDDSEGCKPAGIKRNWKKMSEKKTFDSYIDDKNIYQQDNGEVLFWYLADWSEPDLDGNISRLLLARTNCKTNQMLAIYETIYKQHMAEGGVSGRIWHTEFDSDIGQYINLKWRLIKPKTAMEVLSSYACENANRKVKEEVIEEEDLSSALMIEDQLNILKSAYINNIAAEVRSNWRYPGADDDWSCNVIVLQNENGKVLNVNIQDCNTGSSDNALMTDDKVRAFMNSIERAVYKASPLPMAPDKAVFDREILLKFRVN